MPFLVLFPEVCLVSPSLLFVEIAAKCRIGDLRAHYKNTYEVARAVKGWKLNKAIRYMDRVLLHE